jgi:hypothetical protein
MCFTFTPSSGAIHKRIATSHNHALTSVRFSCRMLRKSARNDPHPRRPTWFHLSPTGVGEGFRHWPLTRPRTEFRGWVVSMRGARRHVSLRHVNPLHRSKIRSPQQRTPKMELFARRRRLHWGPDNASRDQVVGELPLQAPSAIIIASAAEMKSSPPRTANCLRRRKTPTFQTVTKANMTIDNQSDASRPVTSAPPNGL